MVKIVYDLKILKYLGLDGLVLYPYVLISTKKEETSPVVLKHELTHVEQIERDGIFAFYSSYVLDILRWKSVDKAYENNKYEIEAYKKERSKLTNKQKLLI